MIMRAWLAVAGCGAAVCQGQGVGEELVRLRGEHPGVRALLRNGRVTTISGAMTAGANPRAAAERWLERHGRIFGRDATEVEPAWSAVCRGGAMTVFAYRQRMEGFPVDGGVLRVAVRHGPSPRVVYVGATLADRPSHPRQELQVPGWMARMIAAAAGAGQVEGEPELVVLRWEGERGDRWVWKVGVRDGERPGSVYVDVMNGRVLEVRAGAANMDISGTVVGMGTPINMLPDRPDNPPVLMGLPWVRVNSSAGGPLFTDGTGAFVVHIPGAGQGVTLHAPLGFTAAQAGLHAFVHDDNGGFAPSPWAFSASVGPVVNPASGVLVQMPTVSSLDNGVAQVNALVNAHRAYDFVMSRVDFDYPLLEGPLRIRVNNVMPWWVGGQFVVDAGQPTIRLARAQAFALTTRNASYSGGFVLHEYGHYVGWVLGLPYTDSFGEGFADSFQAIVNDDPVQGREYVQVDEFNAMHVRDDPTLPWINCQYPLTENSGEQCWGIPHQNGQLLSGIWWDVRKNMVSTPESTGVADDVRDLFVAWMLLTTGGEDKANPAGCHTLEEVLAADDDDGIPGNGTPNSASIIAAFESHNLGAICGYE